jgi:hypothetical protein
LKILHPAGYVSRFVESDIQREFCSAAPHALDEKRNCKPFCAESGMSIPANVTVTRKAARQTVNQRSFRTERYLPAREQGHAGSFDSVYPPSQSSKIPQKMGYAGTSKNHYYFLQSRKRASGRVHRSRPAQNKKKSPPESPDRLFLLGHDPP